MPTETHIGPIKVMQRPGIGVLFDPVVVPDGLTQVAAAQLRRGDIFYEFYARQTNAGIFTTDESGRHGRGGDCWEGYFSRRRVEEVNGELHKISDEDQRDLGSVVGLSGSNNRNGSSCIYRVG